MFNGSSSNWIVNVCFKEIRRELLAVPVGSSTKGQWLQKRRKTYRVCFRLQLRPGETQSHRQSSWQSCWEGRACAREGFAWEVSEANFVILLGSEERDSCRKGGALVVSFISTFIIFFLNWKWYEMKERRLEKCCSLNVAFTWSLGLSSVLFLFVSSFGRGWKNLEVCNPRLNSGKVVGTEPGGITVSCWMRSCTSWRGGLQGV